MPGIHLNYDLYVHNEAQTHVQWMYLPHVNATFYHPQRCKMAKHRCDMPSVCDLLYKRGFPIAEMPWLMTSTYLVCKEHFCVALGDIGFATNLTLYCSCYPLSPLHKRAEANILAPGRAFLQSSWLAQSEAVPSAATYCRKAALCYNYHPYVCAFCSQVHGIPAYLHQQTIYRCRTHVIAVYYKKQMSSHTKVSHKARQYKQGSNTSDAELYRGGGRANGQQY